ncbi:MAG: NAD(P)/FAD-dependent oxidoreductase, partial [Mesorhizobium sp.]
MTDTTIRSVADLPATVEPAIVVGAGAAGLAAAHALMNAGVPTAILEKESRLAEPWHRRHQQLHLNTSAGPRFARNVVIATGRDRQPFTPEWKGMKDFVGRIIHSADFGDAQAYAGQKVLVVGAGNSGFDALNHLAGIDTAAIWLSARNGPALLPKRICKIAVHRLSPI